MNPAQRLLERKRLQNLGFKSDPLDQARVIGRMQRQQQQHSAATSPPEAISATREPKQPVGTFDGLCNRTACRRPGARWWNRGSYAHYCTPCAHMLNKENLRSAEEFLGVGQKLCVLMETAEHHPLSTKYDYPKVGSADVRW